MVFNIGPVYICYLRYNIFSLKKGVFNVKRIIIPSICLMMMGTSVVGVAETLSTEDNNSQATQSTLENDNETNELNSKDVMEETDKTTEPSGNSQTEEKKAKKEMIYYNGEAIEIESESDDMAGLDKHEVPEITEENQHELGNVAKSNEAPRRMRRSTRGIASNTANLPRMDFVDVSSHQDYISVADYLNMKKQGVTGVVVKLTESTNYRNPFAKSQIANAKAAGLQVSVYHYSWFTNRASAEAEAAYFSKYAKELGLGANTVMVNDAEQGEINNGRTTENSLYFAAALSNQHGFNTVLHYSMASWFTSNVLDMSKLGGNKLAWMAQFPNSPSKNNLMHQHSAAWQWGSTIEFVGDSKSRYFDVNIDYTGTFSSTFDSKPISRRTLINRNDGVIYDRPYIQGAYAQDKTDGMLGQAITLEAESVTSFGIWYQFSYSKAGVYKVGWIKSVDVSDVMNRDSLNETFYVKNENGAVYNGPYTNGTQRITNTANFKNKEFKATEKATTAYGLWYKGTFEQNGKVIEGWIKSVDLTTELVTIRSTQLKRLITTNSGAIYESPYVKGTRKLDSTSGMLDQAIDITAESKTSYGTWYQFNYNKGQGNKVGWIKSVDISDVINKKSLNAIKYVKIEHGAVYDTPYTEKTKRLGSTNDFKDKEFRVKEEATTGYGLWYKGHYTQNGKEKSGWIKSVDLVDELINSKKIDTYMVVTTGAGAVYDTPYTKETKRIGSTQGMNGKMIHVTSESKTSYGLWYEFTYEESGKSRTGWIKSVDVATETFKVTDISKKRFVTTNNGAIYESPYVRGTGKQIMTSGMKDTVITLTAESKTSYGTWYQFAYNNGQKIGWIKSVDVSDVINQHSLSKTVSVKIEHGAVYDTPYTETTKRIDNTGNFYKKEFKVTEEATTAYGTWYNGSYEKEGKKKTGWIKSVDVSDEYVEMTPINKYAVIRVDYGVIYEAPYTKGIKAQEKTSGLYGEMIQLKKESKTSYGLWYEFNYYKSSKLQTGWIKSTDLTEEFIEMTPSVYKEATINKNSGAIYTSPYVDKTKRTDTLNGLNNQTVKISSESKTSYGLWYKATYTKNNKQQTGWIKSVDLKDMKK